MFRLKARVGPKGQAVIPKPVRDALGIQPGDEVYFSAHGDHVHLEKRPPGELLREFFAALPERGPGHHLSSAELKELREEQYEEEFTEREP